MELEVCHHFGIGHSAFLAWPPDDQDKALAYQAHLHEAEVDRSRACPSCHTHPEDWVDPDSGRRLVRPKWVVELEECPGCAVIESETGQLDAERRRRVMTRLRVAVEEDFDDPVDGDG